MCAIGILLACSLFQDKDEEGDFIDEILMVLINSIVAIQVLASICIFAQTVRLSLKNRLKKKVSISEGEKMKITINIIDDSKSNKTILQGPHVSHISFYEDNCNDDDIHENLDNRN